MTETEWRNIGIQQSPGWEHYMIHSPGEYWLNFCYIYNSNFRAQHSDVSKEASVII